MIMEHNFACVFASVVKTMDACEPDSGGHASEKVNKKKRYSIGYLRAEQNTTIYNSRAVGPILVSLCLCKSQ